MILSASTTGLGVVRGLHRRGVRTIVVCDSSTEPVFHSRLPEKKLVAAGRTSGERDQARTAVLDAIHEPRPVLIPTSDEFVDFMVRHRERLAQQFDFCIPSDELAGVLIDKSRETRLIESLGIALPKTVQVMPSRPVDLLALLRLPIIIKPRSYAEMRSLGRKNVVVGTVAELEAFYASYGTQLAGLLAQEVIPGDDDTQWVCHCNIGWNHELVSAFTFRRLRLTPSHYGVTSYGVSERNKEVIDRVRTLGGALRYTGSAGVEFKYDSRDGVYKYIELNPRIGLCNALDAACGVNTVWLGYQLARRADPGPVPATQREGVVYLSLFDDLYSRRRDHESLGTALRHYASHAGRLRVGAFFAWNDPWPAFTSSWRNAQRLTRGLLGRLWARLTPRAEVPQ